MLGQIIHGKTQFKKIHSHYISTIQLQSSTVLRFTYKLKLFLCVFVCMCWGCAFSTLDALLQTSKKYVVYKYFSNKKKTQYLIHFIAAPTFQGYRYHDFLFKCCFGRMPGLIRCKSQLQKSHKTGIPDISPCIFANFLFFPMNLCSLFSGFR